MNAKNLAIFTVLLVAVGWTAVQADDDYHYLAVCDSRCDIKNRMNPFAESCDYCCRSRGFRKGKCKGFGWQYCMCKPHGIIRSLIHGILNR